MTVKTSISLTDEQEAFARSLVDAGRYSSLSAVLQQGLDMLRRDTEAHDAEIAAMRALIDQREAGKFMSIEENDALVRVMLDEARSAYAGADADL